MKPQRTFGWVQNPANTATLQRIVAILDPNSDFTQWLIEERIPLLRENNMLHDCAAWDRYVSLLKTSNPIPYSSLKGKGNGKEKRGNAKCSGIVQAVVDAQKSIELKVNGKIQIMHKPYTDDWTADGFLRWGISIGFIDYDTESDSCQISELGRKFILSSGNEFNNILGEAYLSYPPVCRILQLLSTGEHLTKFEIGKNLGFASEEGFTSFPQNIWVQAYQEHPADRHKIRSNFEGSSDKYARMICSWLNEIGWVNITGKNVTENYGGKTYSCTIAHAYTITAIGLANYKKAIGKSSLARSAKRVFFSMLSTKPADKEYLRLRRSLILQYTNKGYRSLEQIKKYLATCDMDEEIATIIDDLQGLASIGLNFAIKSGCYKLIDKIQCLQIPVKDNKVAKSDISLVKDRIRTQLNYLNQKYLVLIDLSVNGNANLEFEIQTLDLLTNELGFNGFHLGGARKPDGIIFYDTNGLIIDNKAYSSGYTLPRSQVDEMVRYLEENNKRREDINPNKWWEYFDPAVSHFNYSFISSFFIGQYLPRLEEIKNRTGINGAVLSIEQLLLIAEAMKRGILSHSAFFKLFDCNDSINYQLPVNPST